MCFECAGCGDAEQEGVLASAVGGDTGRDEGRKGGHQRLEERSKEEEGEGVVAMGQGKGRLGGSVCEKKNVRGIGGVGVEVGTGERGKEGKKGREGRRRGG